MQRSHRRLSKKAKKGFRGYPVATMAFYGPDNVKATRLTVGIVLGKGVKVTTLRRWLSEGGDIRNDAAVAAQALEFIEQNEARSVINDRRDHWLPPRGGYRL